MKIVHLSRDVTELTNTTEALKGMNEVWQHWFMLKTTLLKWILVNIFAIFFFIHVALFSVVIKQATVHGLHRYDCTDSLSYCFPDFICSLLIFILIITFSLFFSGSAGWTIHISWS